MRRVSENKQAHVTLKIASSTCGNGKMGGIRIAQNATYGMYLEEADINTTKVTPNMSER